MNHTTETQLFDLLERQKQLWQKHKQSLPLQDFDDQWLSPCQVGDAEDGLVQWSAVKRDSDVDLANIEQALELQLHPSIVQFFCSAFAGYLPATYEEHPIELIQAWNEEDFNLLQENMIAHFLMQKRLKKPASMFIATCSDEMQIISVLNETGQVQLETLGKGQEAILSETLSEFLTKLQPVLSIDEES